jgi:hypothetical protein
MLMKIVVENKLRRNFILIIVLGFVYGIISLLLAYETKSYIGWSTFFGNWLMFCLSGSIFTVPIIMFYNWIVVENDLTAKLPLQLLIMGVIASLLALLVIAVEDISRPSLRILTASSIVLIFELYVYLNYCLAGWGKGKYDHI